MKSITLCICSSVIVGYVGRFTMCLLVSSAIGQDPFVYPNACKLQVLGTSAELYQSPRSISYCFAFSLICFGSFTCTGKRRYAGFVSAAGEYVDANLFIYFCAIPLLFFVNLFIFVSCNSRSCASAGEYLQLICSGLLLCRSSFVTAMLNIFSFCASTRIAFPISSVKYIGIIILNRMGCMSC